MGSSKILDLRNLLAERFPQSFTCREARLRTDVATLDEITGGGLPKSAITELISTQPSAGSASLIHALLAAAQAKRTFLALIDGRDSFDPASATNADALKHLLWLRCNNAAQAVKAADLLLRDGNFPLVALDLVLNRAMELRKIPQTYWFRLQRLVEPAPAALLVLTRTSLISSARLKIVLENRWRLADLERSDAAIQLQMQVQRVHGTGHNYPLRVSEAAM